MSRGVVITGLGVVSAAGAGVEPLVESLARGTPQLTEVARPGGNYRHVSSRTAALVPKLDLSRWIAPLAARRMSRPSRFAIAAARMALADAGLAESGGGRCSLQVATAFGPVDCSRRLLDQLEDDGADAMSPFLFAESVNNAPVGNVAIQCGLTGPNLAVCAREAGPLVAVARGASDILAGRDERALVGAYDEMTPLLHSVLDRFRALATARGGGPERARPFDARRNGVLAAEGCTLVTLEERAAADARGAKIRLRVRGWGGAFDPSASQAGWGTDAGGLARGLRRCLDRCRVEPEAIDLIVSGAAGSIAGDRLEARVLRAVWGETALPPVVAPKAVTGEYGGAALAAAILLAEGAALADTADFAPDDELGLSCARGLAGGTPHTVLVSGLASGGPAGWLVLERA